jgi:hypothetical protein
VTAKAHVVEAKFGGDGKLAMDLVYDCYALCLLAAALLLNLRLPALLAVVYVGLYACYNLFHPIRLSTISDIAGTELRATLISVDSLLETLLTSLLAPLLGWIAEAAGIPAAFLFVGLAGVAINHAALIDGHCLRLRPRAAAYEMVDLEAETAGLVQPGKEQATE